MKTNKSPGPDYLPPMLLKETIVQTTKALNIIFNESMSTSTLPKVWKTSNVSPIHKKGSKSKCDNYRPVSLTCIASKLMESIVRDEIMAFLLDNNRFIPQQYGFLPKRTAILQLLKVLDDWTEALDKNEIVEIVYMDFKKAFDSVPHNRLLYKLHHLGIRGNLHNWIESFLTGRSQRVSINGTLSSPTIVTSGIPQGSVLGPLLFVIFVNDLPWNLTSNTLLFADDTKAYMKYPSTIHLQTELSTKIQDDLNKMNAWSDKWLLKFNSSKCKQMLIHKPRQNPIPLPRYLRDENNQEVQLEQVTEEKDLGIIVDNHLSFKPHIATITAKARRNMGIIRRTMDHLDKEVFVPLYTSLVRSQLDYGHAIWNPYQQQDVKRLEQVQRNATKKVNGLRETPYEERLKFLGLTTLSFRRLRGDMIEAYKILHELYDPIVSPTLVRDHSTRRGNSFKLYVVGNYTSDIRKYCFVNRIIKHWNSLPNHVVEAPSLNAFKNRLDKEWKNHPLKYNPDLNPHSLH